MSSHWQERPLSTALTWLLRIALIGLLIYQLFYTKDYLFTLATLVAIVFSIVPSIIEHNKDVHLPFELNLLITLALFFHTFLGEWLMFYERVWLWDKFLHFYATVVISIVAFMLVYTLHFTRKLRLTLPFIGFFTVIFALAIGVMWEIFEFFVDTLLNGNMQKGLADTMWDMIYDLFGGLIVAVAGMFYVRYSNPDERKRLARPLGEVLFGGKWGGRWNKLK